MHSSSKYAFVCAVVTWITPVKDFLMNIKHKRKETKRFRSHRSSQINYEKRFYPFYCEDESFYLARSGTDFGERPRQSD